MVAPTIIIIIIISPTKLIQLADSISGAGARTQASLFRPILFLLVVDPRQIYTFDINIDTDF